MSILSSLIENIQKEQEHKQSAKSKLVDFEKMIADEARSQGMLPRTYLEQLCQKSESFANSKLVKVLMGEQSAVDEGKVKDMVLDMEADAAEMSKEEFIKAHGSQNADIWDRVQDEMRGDTNEGAVKDYLMDLEDDATKMNKEQFVAKHGEGKAKIWDKVNSPDYKDISDLMDGNEFAQKVRQLKAQGAKPGTKFKTSDGQEHTLEQIIQKTRNYLDMLEQKLKEQSMSEDEHEDKGEIQFGSYQTKHFDMCPSATDLYKDGKFKNMDLAERSVKLQDTLFYMEKHAMEMKKVDEQYVVMMQNLADQIMAMAKMMDMEEEHNYIQSHVDAVKNMDESVRESKAITEQEFEQLAEKKDACYHKVKSRYKVWPSAYASGALVRCRKVGAKNWGNKSKK